MQIVTFTSAGGVYGIPVLAVEEFFRPVGMTRVPRSDRRVAGLMNHRGKSATVLNLQQCFHRSKEVAPAHPKMILLETAGRLTREAISAGVRAPEEPTVLLVDRILDIISIGHADLHERPAHISEKFIAGILRQGSDYVSLIDLVSLVDEIHQHSSKN
ncbi:chemotaxis protein CheW [Planctomicrobium sp. SH661]|uniref:chemotaxis protein CheW n=1 Tax=Planctomicrobium sp. SH661 TaxID=3448124 RepID=UPI003F5CAC2D